MNRDQIIQMEDDIRVQSQLKRFINDPKDFDFSHGSAVNDYKGDMHRFSLHANKMLCDMLVAQARYSGWTNFTSRHFWHHSTRRNHTLELNRK